MVVEQVVKRAAYPHDHALAVGVVVLHHAAGAARPLEVVSHVGRVVGTKGGLDPLPVSVVDEAS